MKLSFLSIGLLAFFLPLISAWSSEDHEIFRIRDELIQHEGADLTFYDFIGVTASASQDEIIRAYRKKTKALHPDKVRANLQSQRANKAKRNSKSGTTVTKSPSQAEIKAAVKEAGEKQARLGIVADILKGPGRERYDHFLSHGFPTWKGTGYYYSRYRPGLGTVLFGCFLAGGGAFHYLALYMSWKRQREFVERYIKFARHTAWGDNMGIPGVNAAATAAAAAAAAAPPAAATADEDQQPAMAMNRKQRRMQERDAKKESAKESKRQPRSRSGKSVSGSATPVPQAPAPATNGPTGAKKRVVAENGKILVVDSIGDVYLEQEDEEGNVNEFLLDPNELPAPTIRDTALFKLPIWAYSITMGRALGKKDVSEESDSDEIDGDAEKITDDYDSDVPQRTPSSTDEDFELVDTSRSVEDLVSKATGNSQGGGKAKKRNKKR
ncbi:hypothetical protein BX600DRAFT_432455 [Xylariales sp. PMI_506]|nr:hypothetical protein BX600DRAFT_432455 [Xylariales sp. PMI_506]